MSLTPVRLTPRKQEDAKESIIQLSKPLLKHLKINNITGLTIMAGGVSLTPTVEIKNFDSNQMVISEKIFEEFSLPIKELKLLALYHPAIHTLQLGPIIGLLTDSITFKEDAPNFRTIHGFCDELAQVTVQSGGFFYVFSPEQFSIEGFYYEDGEWALAKLPVPDVIYNRIHSRRLERKKEFIQFKNKLEKLMIPFFNDRFLSKWDVYEQVKEQKDLLPHIPNTNIYSKEHLIDFIQKYESVFIKPVHGSQGRNILKIVKEEESLYSIQTSGSSLSEELKQKYNLDQLHQQIKPFLHNRLFIIQQGINLVKFEDCSLDFRVLCHKNYNGQWKVTSMVARVASVDKFVSNIAKGGQVLKPLQALNACLDKKSSNQAFTRINDLALNTASVVSQNESGLTGELGIDIGVDSTGHPWLIEVNSKPSKSFEDDLGKIRPSAKAIIQLCTMFAYQKISMKE